MRQTKEELIKEYSSYWNLKPGGHFCVVPEEAEMHHYGDAIEVCLEDFREMLFVDNNEYATQVNFCPICGYKAAELIKEAKND